MKFGTPKCPTCNRYPRAIIEEIKHCSALLDRHHDGSFDYAGETEVNWDGQEAVTDAQGRVTLKCGNNHTWQSTVDWEA